MGATSSLPGSGTLQGFTALPGNTVALALAGDISIMEIAGPCEIFGGPHTDLADPWYDFTLCGVHSSRVGSWFRLHDICQLDMIAQATTIVVAGARDPAAEAPPEDLVKAVRTAYEAGSRMVSVCTGAFVLAEAGILDGRRATTHWRYSDLLGARYPAVKVDPDVLYTDEGDVLTAAGMAAGVDLCLHIVRTDYGSAIANTLARRLVTPPHRDGGQAQFIAPPAAGSGEHVLSGLLSWVIANLDQPLTVADMSRRAGMSTRNLARKFNAITGKGPLQWLLTQRIYRAQELLERTDYTVERVAAESGMVSATTLRRHFKRIAGVTPDTYRRTFRDVLLSLHRRRRRPGVAGRVIRIGHCGCVDALDVVSAITALELTLQDTGYPVHPGAASAVQVLARETGSRPPNGQLIAMAANLSAKRQ